MVEGVAAVLRVVDTDLSPLSASREEPVPTRKRVQGGLPHDAALAFPSGEGGPLAVDEENTHIAVLWVVDTDAQCAPLRGLCDQSA